jgi:hypothetical protein
MFGQDYDELSARPGEEKLSRSAPRRVDASPITLKALGVVISFSMSAKFSRCPPQ